MFISYNWLNGVNQTPSFERRRRLRERLTMVGLAIDAVESHGQRFGARC